MSNIAYLLDKRIASLFESLCFHIRLNHTQRAHQLYEEVSWYVRNNSDIEDQLYTAYLLVSARYALYENRLADGEGWLQEVSCHYDTLAETQRYYFHLYNGIACYEKKTYTEAMQHFEDAERYLYVIKDPVEIGDFHYRKAMVFYYLEISPLAIMHTDRAIAAFQNYSDYHLLLAKAQLLQGLNYIDMQRYQIAATFLEQALNLAKTAADHSLIMIIEHNLGYLYIEEKQIEQAIPHLLLAAQDPQQRAYLKTLLLLAQAYWELEMHQEALKYYQKGFQLSMESGKDALKWEFAMLHKKYADPANFAFVWEQGIAYFLEKNDRFNVRTYAKELAAYYTEREQYESAAKYYQLALLK